MTGFVGWGIFDLIVFLFFFGYISAVASKKYNICPEYYSEEYYNVKNGIGGIVLYNFIKVKSRKSMNVAEEKYSEKADEGGRASRKKKKL